MSLPRANKEWVNLDNKPEFQWDPLAGRSNTGNGYTLLPNFFEPYLIKEPSNILTCWNSDLFSPANKENWIGEILFCMQQYLKRHRFIVVTNASKSLLKWIKIVPKNLWLGIRISKEEDMIRPFYLKMLDPEVRFILVESLDKPININLRNIDWVVVDGNPEDEEKMYIRTLVQQAVRMKVPVFISSQAKLNINLKNFPNCIKK